MPKTICIAPGHGGFDPGAVGNGLKESDINLQVSLQLKCILEMAGIPVVMTRTKDVAAGGANNIDDDLRNQCAISNAANVDLFFSVHVNAGGGTGAEIYVFGDGGGILPVAESVVNSVASIMGAHGDAVKDGSDLYVVRNTTAPSMLLEIGFIDSTDADKIKQHLHDFAALIAPSLIEYLGGTQPTPVKEVYVMTEVDANGIIDRWIRHEYEFASDADKLERHRLADELRKASGQEVQ